MEVNRKPVENVNAFNEEIARKSPFDIPCAQPSRGFFFITAAFWQRRPVNCPVE